ncbi:MAG: AURKAIP1/COX24 domain-containing protein [Proteobacteria bacterium]|nr:AURKAIP1/COX24 domain-containing protein [Pseudomonadota bacterium]
MGNVIKKRKKKISRHKHRKLLAKTRHKRKK